MGSMSVSGVSGVAPAGHSEARTGTGSSGSHSQTGADLPRPAPQQGPHAADAAARLETKEVQTMLAAQLRDEEARLADRERMLAGLERDLERVKLYPPYPIDESPRADLIRKFNNLQPEIARMESVGPSARAASWPPLVPLAPMATSDEIDAAIAAIESRRFSLVGQADLAHRRLEAAAPAASTIDPAVASTAARAALAATSASLTPPKDRELRELG